MLSDNDVGLLRLRVKSGAVMKASELQICT